MEAARLDLSVTASDVRCRPDAVGCCLGTALRLLGILPSPSTSTRKRGPDSGGTLRPPFRTARVPCSAFFTGRPLSCALSLERAGPITASGLPKPRVPRRLIDRYCSPIFARGVEPRPCSHSSSGQIGAGLRACRRPHWRASRAELVLLVAATCSGRCACVLRCAGLLKSIAARCSVLR